MQWSMWGREYLELLQISNWSHGEFNVFDLSCFTYKIIYYSVGFTEPALNFFKWHPYKNKRSKDKITKGFNFKGLCRNDLIHKESEL